MKIIRTGNGSETLHPVFSEKIWIILLLILVGGMIGAISYRMIRTMKMPVEYESVSKLYITFNQDENGMYISIIMATPGMSCWIPILF